MPKKFYNTRQTPKKQNKKHNKYFKYIYRISSYFKKFILKHRKCIKTLCFFIKLILKNHKILCFLIKLILKNYEYFLGFLHPLIELIRELFRYNE